MCKAHTPKFAIVDALKAILDSSPSVAKHRDADEVVIKNLNVSNMFAEAKALLQGVQVCIDGGFLNVDLEVDSLILSQIVQKKVEPPWCIMYEIRMLFDLLCCNFSISHTYRENNMAADLLSNIGYKEGTR